MRPFLTFWRDSNGNEIDLLLTQESGQLAYEIKSGATPSDNYFKGLKYWSALSNVSSDHFAVVYGGGESRITSFGKLIPWSELNNASNPR